MMSYGGKSDRIMLETLNDAQKKAVMHYKGPAVVYAGAGSGKTRVICSRIAYLIKEKNEFPSSILAVTFTNKAAKEMEERVESILGQAPKNLIISTFHSFCARFLRLFASDAGYTNHYSIYDDKDSKSLIKQIMKDLHISEKFISVANLKSKIDSLKNSGLTSSEYKEKLSYDEDFIEKESLSQKRSFGEQYPSESILSVFEVYESRLKKLNAMDFNDLILVMKKLLQDNQRVRTSLQDRFKFFLIDEFQDTNPLQFELITLLSSHTENVFIVGDDDQSIYSWRGGCPSYILNFEKLFKNTKTYKLEQNYRSSAHIIQASSQLISHNRNRAQKTLWTENPLGEKIHVKSCQDPYLEAEYVVSQVLDCVKNGKRFSDFCLLYRTNAQSRSLEDELRRKLVPYIIFGSVRFYERAEIKALMSYLILLVNPKDDASFEKVVNIPRRGFGQKALLSLRDYAQNRDLSLFEASLKLTFESDDGDALGRASKGLKAFCQLYLNLIGDLEANDVSLSELFSRLISEIDFESYLKKSYPDDFDERWLNVIELKNALFEYEEKNKDDSKNLRDTLGEFIQKSLLTIEPTTVNVREGEKDALILMTIHSAKGLEFNTVFVTGLEEGILPHQNSIEDNDDVEEERRLLYVAMTRARQSLYLTYCLRNRYRDFMPSLKSRFLYEIPDENRYEDKDFTIQKEMPYRETQARLSRTKMKRTAEYKKGKETVLKSFLSTGDLIQGKDPLNDDAKFQTGQKVKHKIFGEGVIQNMEKGSNGYRVKVKFLKKSFGEKVLLENYLINAD